MIRRRLAGHGLVCWLVLVLLGVGLLVVMPVHAAPPPPTWSPDGLSLAWTAPVLESHPNFPLWPTNWADAANVTKQHTDDTAASSANAPDSLALAQPMGWELWTFHVPTRWMQLVATEPAWCSAPAWLARGDGFIYTRFRPAHSKAEPMSERNAAEKAVAGVLECVRLRPNADPVVLYEQPGPFARSWLNTLPHAVPDCAANGRGYAVPWLVGEQPALLLLDSFHPGRGLLLPNAMDGRWSPDGRYLAYCSAMPPRTYQLLAVDVLWPTSPTPDMPPTVDLLANPPKPLYQLAATEPGVELPTSAAPVWEPKGAALLLLQRGPYRAGRGPLELFRLVQVLLTESAEGRNLRSVELREEVVSLQLPLSDLNYHLTLGPTDHRVTFWLQHVAQFPFLQTIPISQHIGSTIRWQPIPGDTGQAALIFSPVSWSHSLGVSAFRFTARAHQFSGASKEPELARKNVGVANAAESADLGWGLALYFPDEGQLLPIAVSPSARWQTLRTLVIALIDQANRTPATVPTPDLPRDQEAALIQELIRQRLQGRAILPRKDPVEQAATAESVAPLSSLPAFLADHPLDLFPLPELQSERTADSQPKTNRYHHAALQPLWQLTNQVLSQVHNHVPPERPTTATALEPELALFELALVCHYNQQDYELALQQIERLRPHYATDRQRYFLLGLIQAQCFYGLENPIAARQVLLALDQSQSDKQYLDADAENPFPFSPVLGINSASGPATPVDKKLQQRWLVLLERLAPRFELDRILKQ